MHRRARLSCARHRGSTHSGLIIYCSTFSVIVVYSLNTQVFSKILVSIENCVVPCRGDPMHRRARLSCARHRGSTHSGLILYCSTFSVIVVYSLNTFLQSCYVHNTLYNITITCPEAQLRSQIQYSPPGSPVKKLGPGIVHHKSGRISRSEFGECPPVGRLNFW